MLQPSFFIVGAPKCGTTALCKYLNRHPNIFIPTLKELHYFDTDLNTKKKANSLDEYLAIFAEGRDEVCGEGTPTYLYSKTAASNIYDFNPEAKIIIMLRNPVSMMYSFHAQHLFNGSSENIQDFETALNLESNRKQGRDIPTRCREPQLLYYRDFASYTDQVQRYIDVFGEKQIKIILFEDFKEKTADVFRDTLKFIDVDPEFTTDLLPVNSSKKVRNATLQSLIKYPPSKVLEIGKYLLPIPQSWRRGALEYCKAQLKKLNTQQAPRPPLDRQLRERLTKEFEPEIKRLEQLIDRDLSSWYST
jgi:hypothetical protein